MLKYIVIFILIINISGCTSNYAQKSFGDDRDEKALSDKLDGVVDSP